MIRRIGPQTEIVGQTVLLGILMDVGDQIDIVGVRGHRDATERVPKQAAGSLIALVDRFGIGVEQASELLTGLFWGSQTLGVAEAPRVSWWASCSSGVLVRTRK